MDPCETSKAEGQDSYILFCVGKQTLWKNPYHIATVIAHQVSTNTPTPLWYPHEQIWTSTHHPMSSWKGMVFYSQSVLATSLEILLLSLLLVDTSNIPALQIVTCVSWFSSHESLYCMYTIQQWSSILYVRVAIGRVLLVTRPIPAPFKG